MVFINCATVGAAWSAFEVEIEDAKNVSGLKVVIKEMMPNKLQGVNANDLQLFLAKKDGKWLQDDEALDTMSKEEMNTWLRKKMRPTWKLNKSELFEPGVSLGEEVIHVLAVVPGGAPVPGTTRKRKTMERMGDADAPDAWMKELKDEQVEVLPSTLEDLKAHLERELRVKVPIDDILFKMVSSVNISGVYQ